MIWIPKDYFLPTIHAICTDIVNDWINQDWTVTIRKYQAAEARDLVSAERYILCIKQISSIQNTDNDPPIVDKYTDSGYGHYLDYSEEREVDTRMVLNHNLTLDGDENLDPLVPRTVTILSSNVTHDRARLHRFDIGPSISGKRTSSGGAKELNPWTKLRYSYTKEKSVTIKRMVN